MFELESISQEVNSYREPLAKLKLALHLDQAAERSSELESITAEPDFWQDQEKAGRIQQELSRLQAKIENFHKLSQSLDDLELMIELADETGEADILPEIEEDFKHFKHQFEAIRLATLLTGDHDADNAILTLHAGAGGTEAQDWVSMLLRMYQRWAESHDFQLTILDYLDGDEAGIKSVSLKIAGDNAYGYLRSEMGVHRLVRISPFDSSGRRHTSFASVEVMPELDDSIEVNIKSDDLRIDYFRASGAGGQHVNKTSSAVRITHLPTGLVVSCQNERSQIQNRETAMKMLRAKLYTLAQRAQLDRIEDLKGDQMEIGWGSQIRSYVFCPYTKVKDHRTDYETSDLDAVMDGDLDPFIEAYLAQDNRN